MATRNAKTWEPRYVRTEIRERVVRELARRIPPGDTSVIDVKGIAERIGISADDWYKRTGKRGTPFTVRELACIAEVLGAPRMWPFAEWSELAEKFGPGPGGK
jgi:hypothetical protein